MKRQNVLGVVALACLLAPPGHGLGRMDVVQGHVTTFAGGNHHGHGDDLATLASFDGPRSVAADGQGDLYVSDYFNACIRFVGADGMVRTIAGGSSGDADGRNDAVRFRYPTGVALDPAGGLYIADTGNHRIRHLTYDKLARTATVTTLAGSKAGSDDGVGTAAEFNGPQGVAVDDRGVVYVADTVNHLIRRIQPNGTTTTVAGSALGFADGVGPTAQFARPEGIAVDQRGGLVVADTNNHAIRHIAPDGRVTTLAGDGKPGAVDGAGRTARFQDPSALTVAADGSVYVADTGNSAIRRIAPDGTVSTVAGGHAGFADGLRHDARLARPKGIGVGPAGGLFVADTDNNRIRRIE